MGARGQGHEWEPDRYLRFARERARPAEDLLARLDLESPGRIYDLGCGTGHITRRLAARWPGATVVGVDVSPAMLARARAEPGSVEWVEADLAVWTPPQPADLIFSNAALHWLDDHAALFPRLVGALAPGGLLAVQMPRNYDRPSHTAIAETVRNGPWAGRLVPLLRATPVAPPENYLALLLPLVSDVEIWETTYYHLLAGEDPVAEWTRSTALRPILKALGSDEEREAFMAAYARRLARAYPRRADGRTVFPFRRLFILAHR